MVSWFTLAPIRSEVLGNRKEFPIDLGADTWIVKTKQAWKRNPEIADFPSLRLRDWFKNENKLSLIHRYTVSNLDDKDNYNPTGSRTRPEWAGSLLVLANLSLWLAGISDVAYASLYHIKEDINRAYLFGAASVRQFWPHVADTAQPNLRIDLRYAKQLNIILNALSPKTTVMQGCQFAVLALREQLWKTRYILIWIALESLFGPDLGGELKYRISLRLAKFHQQNKISTSAEELFTHLKKGYDVRSAIVHGNPNPSKIRKISDQNAFLFRTEYILRQSLFKILNSNELTDTFNSNHRDLYLDEQIL